MHGKRGDAEVNSIIQHEKECYICQNPNVEEHHIFFGRGYRKLSEQMGLKIWLCAEHHRGDDGPHQNREIDLFYKRLAQVIYENTHSGAEFMALIGRNYKED
jgi:hypothetical protein